MAEITDIDESLALEELDLVDDSLESPVLLTEELPIEESSEEFPLDESTDGRSESEEIDYITSLITESSHDEPTTLREELLRPIEEVTTTPSYEEAPVASVETESVSERREDSSEEPHEEEDAHDDSNVTKGYSMTCNCVLAKNEKVVRTYELIKKRPDSCIITNKRLIVNGPERVEVSIDRVSGVKAVKYTEINWGKLIFGALFVMICIFALLFDLSKYVSNAILCYLFVGVGVIFGIIGIIMIVKSIHRRFGISILTDALSDFATFRRGLGANFSIPSTVLIGKMGKDFYNFIQEFGAVIITLNSKRK